MKRVKLEEKKEQFPKLKGEYPIAFRRWLIREIVSGHMSIPQAVDRFNFQSKNPTYILRESYTCCKDKFWTEFSLHPLYTLVYIN